MERKIFDYFDGRYRDQVLKKPSYEDGPVITLSRLTGCDARQVAQELVDGLNRKYEITRWKWVDKDIVYDIAKELNTSPERVENFYKGHELSNLSEMIMAFSGNFVSDLQVKKTIKEVVLSMCKEGHLVIVGRGGVSIAQGITDSLHIRLMAPFYWRVQNVMRKKQLTMEAAEEFCINNDQKRHTLITDFLDKKSVNIEYLFDAAINRASFSIQEIADLIISMYEKKVCRQIAERKNTNKIC